MTSSDKETPRMCWVHFLLVIYYWACSLPLKVIYFPRRLSWSKHMVVIIWLLFARGDYYLEVTSELGMEVDVHFFQF